MSPSVRPAPKGTTKLRPIERDAISGLPIKVSWLLQMKRSFTQACLSFFYSGMTIACLRRSISTGVGFCQRDENATTATRVARQRAIGREILGESLGEV